MHTETWEKPCSAASLPWSLGARCLASLGLCTPPLHKAVAGRREPTAGAEGLGHHGLVFLKLFPPLVVKATHI